MNNAERPKVSSFYLLLASFLNEGTSADKISRTIRLLANLSKDSTCLNRIRHDRFIIYSIIKHGSSDSVKCQHASLRALRIICTNKKSSKMAADNDFFPKLLLLLNSSNQDIASLCLRMICEMLKTQAIEVCYRVMHGEVLSKLMETARAADENLKDLCIEIFYLVTLNSSCRVTIAMGGAIEIFVNRLKSLDHTDTFKYSTQGLCLCAREAVSRNRIKMVGGLEALTNVLKFKEYERFHDTIVASFVWFVFDDSSLALLLRANIIPALLSYLESLTLFEYQDYLGRLESLSELSETSTTTEPDDLKEKPTPAVTMPLSDSITLKYNQSPPPPSQASNDSMNSTFDAYQQSSWMMSSPETSPYNPNSPQYSIPSLSPHMSPNCSPSHMSPPHSQPHMTLNYSPPQSPYNQLENQGDGYFSETDTSSASSVPYHFQSADGIHAMIHGARGPIHDTLLLLSRFSQAKDPSSFFLAVEGINALLNYLLLSYRPNQKCARILNRLTLNRHCFDVLLKRKLIVRIYFRLCTGWSLEHLSLLYQNALNRLQCEMSDKSKESPEEEYDDVVDENTYQYKEPSQSTVSLGKLLLQNLRSLCESSYGMGVLSHILLTGSKELKERCVVSLPHILW